MTTEQAREIASLIQAEIAKIPAWAAKPTIKWSAKGEEIVGVEIWHINPRAGNMNLHVVRDYAPDMSAAHLRAAMGAATKADKASFARMAAVAAVDAE